MAKLNISGKSILTPQDQTKFSITGFAIALNSYTTTTGTPVAPLGVSAIGQNNQVRLSWSPVPQAVSYNVYWSTIYGVTPVSGYKLASVNSPYIHVGLIANTTYFYCVTAVNDIGEGPASRQVHATTAQSGVVKPPLPPPPTPSTAVTYPVSPINLVENLPSYFDKDSYPTPVFRVLDERVNHVRVAPDLKSIIVRLPEAETEIDIVGKTIGQIAQAVRDAGFQVEAINLEYDNLKNHTLTNGPTISNTVYFETSFNRRICASIEQFLMSNISDFIAGKDEIYFSRSDNDWLTLWCRYFGFGRLTAEDDAVLFRRALAGISAIKINEKALIKLMLSQLGYSVTITDEYPTIRNTFGIKFQGVDISKLPQVDIDAIIDVVNRYRAAGCFPIYYIQSGYLHTNTVGETTNNSQWRTAPGSVLYIPIVLQHS